MSTDSLTQKDRRELYKAMRSMHDGICPKCGDDEVTNILVANGTYERTCFRCGFVLTDLDTAKILKWHHEFHSGLDEAWAKFKGGANETS